jgi:riboflavin kinase / FMN adenylyltransferase
VRVVATPDELERRPRAVAVGSFDGVHLGHRRVLEAVADSGLARTVVTFDPHPRVALGNRVELVTTPERRLELLADAGVEETLVVPFDLEVAALSAEEFAQRFLVETGAELVVAGPDFRFGRGRAGDLALLERLGLGTETVEELPGVSSTEIRRLVRAGEVDAAAALLGRPFELDGTVVAGDARGGTLGFPTANVALRPDLLVPLRGIYAGSTAAPGAASGHRAAMSVGLNPHYGGEELRVEAFLLEFAGDLYGERLVVEVWQRLRDERAFPSEADLVAEIAADVEATRSATRPPRPADES